MAMKKVKLIRLIILSLVLQNKRGRNTRFYTANFVIFHERKKIQCIIMHHYYIIKIRGYNIHQQKCVLRRPAACQ